MVFSYIFSILLPLALFAIVFLIMFANDRNACVRAAVGKYSDNLLLGSTQLVYTYHNRTDSLYLLPFPSGYIVEIIFSKILRTVAKVATAGLYDMIWNLSKNLNFF